MNGGLYEQLVAHFVHFHSLAMHLRNWLIVFAPSRMVKTQEMYLKKMHKTHPDWTKQCKSENFHE